MRSIRSFSHARTNREGGFALIWAIGLAVLFFMLIQLVLIDSARELAEARRFRSRIVAAALAENAAELAAARMTDRETADVNASDFQGSMKGSMNRSATDFRIVGEGEARGVTPSKATVDVRGRLVGATIHIDYTVHQP
ncbi:MAG TPA: hypothetical protein VEU30_16655 [Thermoanaerobaculia bacterium]|nr:hypothetical protein [Thermoanaerobaculia bacterium]